MGFQVGERVGDYEVVSVLGAGGMGQVYKVRNVISERVEAMKVLLPNLSGDPEGADRFLREIKVQASLTHPNIAGLHTALRVDNQLLMVMEYVEGTTIEAMMQRGSVGMANAVDYTMQVLSALAYAHNHGVVHRDIKPANMMLTPGGQVKLMDFGIARVAQDRRLTQTGRTVGSLFYMSPEQINGQSTDGRSDLYSLGVALYEMITGRRPFDGDSDFSIMAAHLQQNPTPPIQLDPSTPMALNEVVMMAITKDVNARYQNADAFRMALDNVRQLMALPAGQADVTMPLSANAQNAYQDQQQYQGQYGQQQQGYAQEPQYNAAPGPMPFGAPAPAYIPPPPPVAVKQKSSRGMYMAVGSLVTIAVLALAVIKGPEWMKTFAGSKPNDPQQQQATNNPNDPNTPSQPAKDPGTTTPQKPTTPEPQKPNEPVAKDPEPQKPAEPQVDRTPTNPRVNDPRTPRQTTTVARNDPPPQQPNYQQQQQQVPTQQPNYQPQQQVPQQPQHQTVEPNRAALNEVREHHNELAIRAESARQGLQSIKQQMANQGLGLRADIREAETRMNYQLREATSAIRSGDVEGAKKNLEYASRAIEVLEKFLGR